MESDQLTYKIKNENVYISPNKGKHTETVIFLHGLGDSAQGGWFSLFVHQSQSPFPPTAKVVLLQAPTAKVTLNMGMKMPSWYDIKTLNPKPEAFEDSIGIEEVKKNTETLHAVLREEIEALGGDSKRVILAGFSQGCAMSLFAGLEFDKPLGAIVGWSGYLFPTVKVHEANAETPIFIANGLDDPVVPFALADASFKKLDMEKHKVVRLKEKGLGHSVNENVLKETKNFVKKVLEKKVEA